MNDDLTKLVDGLHALADAITAQAFAIKDLAETVAAQNVDPELPTVDLTGQPIRYG